MHYYQYNIADFNNATRHLTRVERSVYRDAIDLYYDSEQPLPADDIAQLERKLLCRSDDEKHALVVILGEFFTLKEGEHHHSRCDLEIEKYRANKSSKARAGKASAEARKVQSKSKKAPKTTAIEQNSTGVEQVLNRCATHEQQTSNHKPVTINHKPVKDRTTNNRPNFDEVSEYILTREIQINPQKFMDYYSANGWKVGRNPMKDWKAAIRTWEQREFEHGREKQTDGIEEIYIN